MGIARAGLEVVIYEPERAPLDRSRAAIAASVGRAVTAGKLGAAERNPLLGRISHTTELGDLADADLVIEAVYEDPDVKGAVQGARRPAACGHDPRLEHVVDPNRAARFVDARAPGTRWDR